MSHVRAEPHAWERILCVGSFRLGPDTSADVTRGDNVTLDQEAQSMPWILASGSPRRRELLAQIVPSFEVRPMDVDESPRIGEHPESLATRLAESKARAAAALWPDAVCLGADTVVWFVEQGVTTTLAKPADPQDAFAMLRLLSGREHFVSTGVSVVFRGDVTTFCERSLVRIDPLTDDQIKAYVATGDPMDKAGAYAIQGGAASFATLVEGSLSNVIGLPVEALSDALGLPTTGGLRDEY